MKMLIILVLVVASMVTADVELNQEQKAKLITYYKECTSAIDLNTELVAKGRKGDFTDDPKLKEYYSCMLKKIGFQNEAGEIQPDQIISKLPPVVDKELAAKLIETCIKEKGATPADNAFLFYKCYWEQSPQHVSLAYLV